MLVVTRQKPIALVKRGKKNYPLQNVTVRLSFILRFWAPKNSPAAESADRPEKTTPKTRKNHRHMRNALTEVGAYCISSESEGKKKIEKR